MAPNYKTVLLTAFYQLKGVGVGTGRGYTLPLNGFWHRISTPAKTGDTEVSFGSLWFYLTDFRIGLD